MGNDVSNILKSVKNTFSLRKKKLEIQLSDELNFEKMDYKIAKLKDLGAKLDAELNDVDGGYFDFKIKLEGRNIDFCYHMNTWVGIKIFVEKPEDEALLRKFLEENKLIDDEILNQSESALPKQI